MFRNILYLFGLFLFVAAINSCDEIDGPYGNEVEIDEPTELTRKAIIFEFTGIHCTNCPVGHEAIHNIDSVYHGHVVPISVHAGYFATPYGDEPDFRTPFGDYFHDNLNQPPTPSVLIGSMSPDYVIVGGAATWQGEVGNVIPDYTKFIIRPSFTFDGSELNVDFQIQERESVDNSLLFYAFIIEDSIVGPQSGTEINPYTHRHVLRKSMGANTGNGVSLIDGVATMNFTSSISSEWAVEHISVVGIIVDAETKEIYSGEIIKSILE